MDLSQQIEADQRRLQERSQIAHMQGQLDDLRHRLEQQAARSQLSSEQAHQVQDMFAQLEARFVAQVEATRQQEQTQLRAYQALQKDVAELRLRMEEPARQALTLMAQVQDLQESLRLLREQAGQGREDQKKMKQHQEDLHAQGLLREERLARLDSLVARLLEGEGERQQEMLRIREAVESERTNLRRSAADLDRLSADLRGEGQELLSRLNRLADLQRQGSATVEAIKEEHDTLVEGLDHLAAESQRIERQTVERSLQLQERVEDLRQALQREWEDLRQAAERREESQNAWLRRIEELYHGLDERLKRQDEEVSLTLSQLGTRLQSLDRAGEGLMRALIETFQQQLEQGAEERLRQIGTTEGEAQAEQVSRETRPARKVSGQKGST